MAATKSYQIEFDEDIEEYMIVRTFVDGTKEFLSGHSSEEEAEDELELINRWS